MLLLKLIGGDGVVSEILWRINIQILIIKKWDIITVDLPKLKNGISDIIKEIDYTSIERIKKVIEENQLFGVEPDYVYHRMVDDTGISLNVISDEKLAEFIRNNII